MVGRSTAVHRRSLVGLVALLALVLSACGRDQLPISPGIGVAEHGESIDALSMTVVTNGDGIATLVGTLLNHGSGPDRLVEVSATTQASAVKSVLDHGPVALPVGEPVRLAAQSAVTFTADKFQLGYLMDVTLRFERAGELTIRAIMYPQAGAFKDVEITQPPAGDGAPW